MASLKDKWLAFTKATPLHLTHKNDVITFFIAAAVVAFKPCQRTVEDGQAALSQRVVHTGKTVTLAVGKALAKLQLISRQHIDDVMCARMEQGQATRMQPQTPQDQWWR